MLTQSVLIGCLSEAGKSKWDGLSSHPSFHTHPFLLLLATLWLAFHISQAPKYNTEAIYKASGSAGDISLWVLALSGQPDLMRNLYKFEWAWLMWLDLIQFHRHCTNTNLVPTLRLNFTYNLRCAYCAYIFKWKHWSGWNNARLGWKDWGRLKKKTTWNLDATVYNSNIVSVWFIRAWLYHWSGWQEYEGLNDTLLWVENINKVSPRQSRQSVTG